MRRLNRPDAPICLNRYKHGRDNWRDVSYDHRHDIWLKLDEMQGHRCAYCENSIGEDAHIEHFRQRGRYPQGTFDWTNLFGSCGREDSCGKHKDKLSDYSHTDLIKMDVENPEDFLLFLSDGSVVERSGLNSDKFHKARETIRVFNLMSLRHIRKRHIVGYLQDAEDFLQMASEFDEKEWRPLLEEKLESIKCLPFSTAIKHILEV